MNQRYAKKIRKQVNLQVRYDLKEVIKLLSEDVNVLKRIGYAFKIVFRYKLGETIK